MNERKVALLIGSGVSAAVGMPSVADITKEILSKTGLEKTERIITHIRGNGIRDYKTSKYDPLILEYLNELKNISENNNENMRWLMNEQKPRHEVNYEDLFFLLTQMYEHINEDYNLFGKLLQDAVKFNDIVKRWNRNYADAYYNEEQDFLRKAGAYIQKTIVRMLKKKPINISRLKFIADICKEYENNDFRVFTLNHDKVFENYLDNLRLEFTDGFGDPDGDIRKWNPRLLENGNNIKLLKLHGSIDWRLFRAKKEKPVLGIYAGDRDIDGDHFEIKDSEGVLNYSPDDPDILIGTQNKIIVYISSFFFEFFYRFRLALEKTDTLIIIGYSFGDAGINTQFMEWLFTKKDNKLIVIDKKDKYGDLYRQLPSRFSHKNLWITLRDENRILYFDSGIEETSWNDIKSQI